MCPIVLYRVAFVGRELGDAESSGLTAAGARWEGSECDAGGVCRHRALIEAANEQEAIAAVRRALAAAGSLGQYDASPVRDARGEPRRGSFYRSWHEIDWQAVPRRARLTDLQRAVLGRMLDAAEPTWIIAADPDTSDDRPTVEAVLRGLQDQGLVDSTLEEGGEPGKESEPDRWWAITDEGWDLLGLIKSPTYR